MTTRPPARPALQRPGTRAVNRAGIIDDNFVDFLKSWRGLPSPAGDGSAALERPVRAGSAMTGGELLEVFEAQVMSRHLDLVAREMRARNEGFYTIGSSGHEGNAVLGALTRTTDPAFLHYRSGAFMMARTLRAGGDPLYDTALSLAASSEDPISGGRHKVWGSRAAWVPPQTSTIASHLPKAVGTAIALEQKKRLRLPAPVPDDAIVVCSFGDASVNHSAAQGAFNAAEWTAYQHLPVPVLFVCEDNGFGISVRTPEGWVAAAFSHRPCLMYFAADGLDAVATHRAAVEAIRACRSERRPVFLHLRLKRLLGHAGTDVESDYRSLAEIEASEALDPLLLTARTLLESGLATAPGLLARYEAIRADVREAAERAATRPRLRSAAEVARPLAPLSAEAVRREARRGDYERAAAFDGAGLPEDDAPRHMAILINRALRDLMAKYPHMTLFGEDVAQKGGVYTVTSGLARTFRGNRVYNTLLDETTTLGMAQGAGMMGLLPFPEIQYLAYFHNACDQIRGEACSLQYFSNDQFRNPMVMRIAALGYQRGFGGHFHNDNSIAALRDIPGLVVACPARGDDAVEMLRTCAALAQVDGRVVAFLEPIALYMTKDLHDDRDGGWLCAYPPPERAAGFGDGRVYDEGDDPSLLIVTYGNGVRMSLRAARRLREARGVATRVLDLRWLKPLNGELVARHAGEIGRVLVVDEGRRTGGVSEEVFTVLDERCAADVVKRRVTGEDCYIPLGAAANLMLPSEDQIVDAAAQLCT